MMKQSAVFRQDLTPISPDLMAEGELSCLRIEVVERPEQVIEQWKILESFAQDPFSNYAWSKAWYEAHQNTLNCSPVIILGTDGDNRPLFLLPLFRQRIGPFNILLRPGRTHSAYSSGLFSPPCRQMITFHNAGQFWKMVFSAVPWADVIAIDGVREAEFAQFNPLRFLPRMTSGNPSYEVLVPDDWESFYKSKMNRKARSNARRCEKRLSERGELRFATGETKDERLALLRTLLAQKADQFRLSGIINPYEMENITSFYERLVQSQDGADSQSLIISAIFLDDRPLAVILGMIKGSGFHGLIMSMVTGELARFSPGRILLLRTMQHLCETGIRKIDFGVGEANYKKEWIDGGIKRSYVLAPLSLKGRVFVLGIRRAAALKALIKSSNWAKSITKCVRWYSMKG
jgi:CelD/BcsL family acetyltransferase involved in cellulose biosynthesis